MSSFTFDGPAWPIGEEWPAGVLPPPCLTIEIAALELEVLIEHHDDFEAAVAELLNVGTVAVKDAHVVLNAGACELTE